MGLTEQAGEQGHEDEANQGDPASRHQLFHALALGSGIVIAVAFEEVDRAPDCETSTKGNNESLKNIHRAVKEFHNKVAGISL